MDIGRHTFRVLRPTRVLVVLVAACLSSFPPFSHATQTTAVDLGGVPVDPFKSSPGKIVVLIFVRTDCPVSNRYSPTIQQLSAQHADKAAFWLVYPSKADSPEMIRKHDQDFGYKLPAVRDLQRALVMQSHATITPEAAVFDANRRLIYHGRIDNLYEDFGRARTAATTHELDDAIQAAISGKALPADTAPAVGCYISDLE
jgi:thiol-disulfide isomerase/thioredoxin